MKVSESHRDSREFRWCLQDAFLSKCRTNSRYSLRAYARFLQIDASTLSQMLRGNRKITGEKIKKLGFRIGLSPRQIQEYLDSSSGPKNRSSIELVDIKNLALDTFELISDWYHYAIFELIQLEGFRNDSKWIAKKLGIHVVEADAAVERLIRLNLVESVRGTLRQKVGFITTVANPQSAEAFRKQQMQILNKALSALEEVQIERRDQSGLTIAISSQRLPEIKEKIRQFRRSLHLSLSRDKRKDEVYQLCISFYPVTQNVSGGIDE